jgi:hypothetical protein
VFVRAAGGAVVGRGKSESMSEGGIAVGCGWDVWAWRGRDLRGVILCVFVVFVVLEVRFGSAEVRARLVRCGVAGARKLSFDDCEEGEVGV